MSTPVPEGMAAVTAITFGLRSASANKALPKMDVYEGALGLDFC